MKRSMLMMRHVLLILASHIGIGGDATGGDETHRINRAAASDLPRGSGLAAAFPRDQRIAEHAAVIFAESFEGSEIGTAWDETRNSGGEVLSLAADGADAGQCLKVVATLGKNTGGGMTKWFQPADTVFIRFYTKFDAVCDYVHHFCTLRANAGLKGSDRWSGFGGAGERPDPRRRFSTALEPWGNWGKLPPPGQWNFYSYWHQMQPAPDGKFWGNSFRPEPQETIRKNTWICAEFMLKHNSPGVANGEQAFWIDGKLLGHWKDIHWRESESLQANAFTLECYVTDRWSKQPQSIVYFDNVVIASAYVGPIAVPPAEAR